MKIRCALQAVLSLALCASSQTLGAQVVKTVTFGGTEHFPMGVPDTGSITLAVSVGNGINPPATVETVEFGQFSTPDGIASAFGGKFSQTSGSLVWAVARGTGGVLTLRSRSGLPITAVVVTGGGESFQKTAESTNCPSTITIADTYNCDWVSTSASSPAVTVNTTGPVTLIGTVSGPGNLIEVNSGANLTVNNVYGVGTPPTGLDRAQRPRFVNAHSPANLVVNHNYMRGVSLGIVSGFGGGNSSSVLTIRNNVAVDMDDGAYDTNGNVIVNSGNAMRGNELGHFIYINNSAYPGGADIAWNQVVNHYGATSTEDQININGVQGGAGSNQQIVVHDNYLEGAFTRTYSDSTGSGINSDSVVTTSSFTPLVNQQLLVTANQVVAVSNVGIGVASGQHISVEGNRVVSCGHTADGHTFARTGRPPPMAVGNYYFYHAPPGAQDQDYPFGPINVANNILRNYFPPETGCTDASCYYRDDVEKDDDSTFPAGYDMAHNVTYSNNDPFPEAAPNCTDTVTSPTTGSSVLVSDYKEWTRWIEKLATNHQFVGPQ